jgi:Fic family protein
MKPYEPRTLPLDDIDWASLVPIIGQANAAVARFEGMLTNMVNPDVLLSPLTTREAVLSSRIEGTQASLEEVLEYEADPNGPIESQKQNDIQEILNYRKAMRHAVETLKTRPLCINLIKELHAILLDSARGRNKDPGNFRRIQNYIGPPGCTQETATFVPPSVDQLGPALDNWEKYCHYDEKDILVQLAVVKAQFELIHPFLDGNGRIGRMLVPLFLFEKKILLRPAFYISAYFETHRDWYYQRLQGISRQGNWNGWIAFFLKSIWNQALTNESKTLKILALYNKMKKDVLNLTRSKYATSTIDALFCRPIFQRSDFTKLSGVPKDTALRILRELKDSRFLKEIRPRSGRQAAIYAFEELINITEATEEQDSG